MLMVDIPTTCDVHNGFGGAVRVANAMCRHLPSMPQGRGPQSGNVPLHYTDILDVDVGVDVRDGCSRGAGATAPTYADGDEVRIPSGSSHRYVVVWVEYHNRNKNEKFKRVYLTRHSVDWTSF